MHCLPGASLRLQKGTAAFYPEPEDKEAFIRAQMYSTNYEDFTPELYDWPTYAYKA